MYESTNLYFYFSPTNNKKEASENAGDGKTKKINGRTYAFDSEGIMLSGWDVYEQTNLFRDADGNKQATYFSGEDDGHQVKKGWVYAVPTETIDKKAHDDDEEKYMYFNNSGIIVTDQFKKINGKYYAFSDKGIMKTGLVLWRTNPGTNQAKYITTIDLDWANGSDLAKGGYMVTDQGQYIQVDASGLVVRQVGNSSVRVNTDKIKIHYFGEDGARKTGLNNVEFADDTYTINTVGSSGDKGTGSFSKKYYALGILLKASPDIRYGIYQRSTPSMLSAQANDYLTDLENGNYYVLNTGGSLQSGSNTAKKDADGNYWMIDKTSKTLRGIYTQNIKVTGASFTTKKIPNTVFSNNGTYTTSTLIRLLGQDNELFINNCVLANSALYQYDTNGTEKEIWKASTANNDTEVQFTSDSIDCGWFQSESGDSASKWIPFGMKDNSGRTCTFNHTACQNLPEVDYTVDPTNDHFVNCYWQNLNNWESGNPNQHE